MKITVCLALLLVFSSCTKIAIEENDPADITEAKKITHGFYADMYNGRREHLYGIIGGTAEKDQFKLLLQQKDSALGRFIENDFELVTTKMAQNDTAKTTEYSIKTRVTYQKGAIQETLGFIKSGNKIVLSEYDFKPAEN